MLYEPIASPIASPVAQDDPRDGTSGVSHQAPPAFYPRRLIQKHGTVGLISRFQQIVGPRTSIRQIWTRQEILAVVAQTTAMSVDKILSKDRSEHIAVARHLLYWALFRLGGMTKSGIARFTERNHTTVIHGIRCVDEAIEKHGDIELLEARTAIRLTWKRIRFETAAHKKGRKDHAERDAAIFHDVVECGMSRYRASSKYRCSPMTISHRIKRHRQRASMAALRARA